MCRRKPCFLRLAFSATSARAVRKSSGRCGTGWRFIHWPSVPGIRWFFRPARALESNTWLSNSSNGSPRRSFYRRCLTLLFSRRLETRPGTGHGGHRSGAPGGGARGARLVIVRADVRRRLGASRASSSDPLGRSLPVRALRAGLSQCQPLPGRDHARASPGGPGVPGGPKSRRGRLIQRRSRVQPARTRRQSHIRPTGAPTVVPRDPQPLGHPSGP